MLWVNIVSFVDYTVGCNSAEDPCPWRVTGTSNPLERNLGEPNMA